MTIQKFAEQYRVTTRKDSCSEVIIAGRPRNAARAEDRCHIFEYGSEKLGVCLLFTSIRKWNAVKERLVAVGCTLKQDADTEGTMLFDPTNATQAKAVLNEVGVRHRRILTPEQRTALIAHGAKTAFETSKTASRPADGPKPHPAGILDQKPRFSPASTQSHFYSYRSTHMRQRAARQPKPSAFIATDMIFADWFKQQLDSHRLTGAELAERADVSKASVYFYLDGSRIPGPDAVAALCAALRVDPSNVPAFERRAVGKPAHRHTETKVAADVL
jgi:hypothetical protein